MTERPDNVPDHALAVDLVPVDDSDVMFGAIGGDLVDLCGGAHDYVFDVFAPKFNRFAAAKYLGPDEPIGWVWTDTGGYDGLESELKEDVIDRFSGSRWSDDPADFGFHAYDAEPA